MVIESQVAADFLHGRFRFGNQPVVVHIQDRAREGFVPERHQVTIPGEVIGELGLVVGISAFEVEQIAQVGEAGAHRIAHQIDQAGSGNRLQDEADVDEVGRQLLGEIAPAFGPPGVVLGIPGAYPPQVGLCQPRHLLGVQRPVAAGDALELRAERGRFAAVTDVGMAGQHLFEQRGSGAVHADDENGRRFARGRPGMVGHAGPIDGLQGLEQPLRVLRPVGHLLAFRGIAVRQRFPGGFMVLGPVQLVVQRDGQVDLILQAGFGQSQPFPYPGDTSAGVFGVSETRLHPVGLGESGVQRQASFDVAPRAVGVAQEHVQIAAEIMRRRGARVLGDGGIDQAQRIVDAACGIQQRAQFGQGLAVGEALGSRAVDVVPQALLLAEYRQLPGDHEQGLAVGAGECGGCQAEFARLAEIVELQTDADQTGQALHMAGVQCQHRAVVLLGRLPVFAQEGGFGLMPVVRDVVRVRGHAHSVTWGVRWRRAHSSAPSISRA